MIRALLCGVSVIFSVNAFLTLYIIVLIYELAQTSLTDLVKEVYEARYACKKEMGCILLADSYPS